MNESLITREQEVLGRLKRKYIELGYNFVEQPIGKQVPDFLANAMPDAIATRGSENIVFEVLSTGKSASSNATAKFLASEIPKHPGWKFELVLTDAASGGDDASFDLRAEDFVGEFEKVNQLVKQKDMKLAIVSGWGLLESLKRFLTLKPSAGAAKRYRPSTVIESLVSEGLIEDEEGEKLSEISLLRNRLVHGFANVDVQSGDAEVLTTVLKKLVGLAENER